MEDVASRPALKYADITNIPSLQPNESGTSALNAAAECDDFMHEILAMNTLAMQRCNADLLDDASTILSEAYMKLHNRPSGDGGDPRMLDTLRSTTLNNLGVVECHRGQHRQALSHFEASRQLEETWGIASPSVALNSCAAYNALHLYDKATAAALETIEMLRLLAAREKSTAKARERSTAKARERSTAPRDGPSAGAKRHDALEAKESSLLSLLPAQTSPGVNIARSDNRALWGAAWHNLAVAQINTARASNEVSEHSNAAALFQNAMRATQELLGLDHPMTRSVTETYRAVRGALRSHGVYRQHHYLRTAPPRPIDPRDVEEEEDKYVRGCGTSRRRAMERFHRDLTVTFRGDVTRGATLTERLDAAPYPGAQEVIFRSAAGTAASRTPHVLRCMALGGTLLRAGQLYGNPHPLLTALPQSYRAVGGPLVTSQSRQRHLLDSPRKRRKQQQQQQQQQEELQWEQQERQREKQWQQQKQQQQRQEQQQQRQWQQQERQQQRQEQQQQRQWEEQERQQQREKQRLQQQQRNEERLQQQQQQQQQRRQHQQDRQSSHLAESDTRHSSSSQGFLPQLKKGQRPYSGSTPSALQEQTRQEQSRDQRGQRPQQPQHNYQNQFQPQQRSRDQQNEGPAPQQSLNRQSTGPIYEQVKYILLADPVPQHATPPAENATGLDKKLSPSVPSQPKEQKQPPHAQIQLQKVLQQKLQNSGDSVGRWEQDLVTEPQQYSSSNNRAAGDDSADWTPAVEEPEGKAHPFFDAMWVTTTKPEEAAAGKRKTRVVGRPSYFVSSTVDLAKEDVLLSGQVTQMIAEGSLSSDVFTA